MASPDDIFQYLPLKYKTQDEEHYIKFLWESFELNYEHGKYQFAFIAYHLLFMTYVYFQLWKMYAVYTDDFRKSILGFQPIHDLFEDLDRRNKQNQAEGNPLVQLYPFDFSKEKESTVMMFFYLIGCDKSKIGKYKSLIRDRNNIAHANGQLVYVSSKDIDQKVEQILKLVEEIQSHSCDTAKECFIKFLKNDSDPNTREYIDDQDQINEVLIRGHYISLKDVTQMLNFDINSLSAESTFPEMKQLSNALI